MGEVWESALSECDKGEGNVGRGMGVWGKVRGDVKSVQRC